MCIRKKFLNCYNNQDWQGYSEDMDWQPFSIKGQIVNMSHRGPHILCDDNSTLSCDTEETLDNRYTDGHGYIPIKLMHTGI